MKYFIASLLSIFFIFFSPLSVFAEDITQLDDNDTSAEITIEANISSVFTVGLPVSVNIDPNTGKGNYNILIKGDIDPNFELIVTPVDGYTSLDGDDTDNINLLLKYVPQKSILFPQKDNIIIDVLQEKTNLLSSELSLDSTYSLPFELIAKSKITAGLWKGVLQYNVSIKPTAPGLYDKNDVLLCTWENSGIDIEQDFTPENYEAAVKIPSAASHVLKVDYPTARTIILPENITRIGDLAFLDCNITKISLPNSINDIGLCAFYYCSYLSEIILPDGITNIPNSTFMGCFNLSNITIPNSVTSIGEFAFSGCKRVDNLIIPNSVTTIGEEAFDGVPHVEYHGPALELDDGSHWGAESIN